MVGISYKILGFWLSSNVYGTNKNVNTKDDVICFNVCYENRLMMINFVGVVRIFDNMQLLSRISIHL